MLATYFFHKIKKSHILIRTKKEMQPGCAIKFFFMSCQTQRMFAAITLYASAFSRTVKKCPCFSALSDFFSMLILLSCIDFCTKVERGQTMMKLLYTIAGI